MKKIFLSTLMLLAASSAFTMQPGDSPAFKGGEILKYTVSYRAKMWPNTDMGNIVIRITNDTINGEPALKIDALATVQGVFSWFFDLQDRYVTWLDKDDMRPLRSTSEIREGDYRYSSDYIYNWDNKTSKNTYRNHSYPTPATTVVDLEHDAMDGVALFFNLRLHNIASYKAGEVRTLPLLLKDKVQLVKYKYYGRETKNIPGLGNLKTYKFSCQLVNDDAANFEDGSEFFVWISADANKVPVYIESPLRVGSVRARLTGYDGLMYKTGSVLK